MQDEIGRTYTVSVYLDTSHEAELRDLAEFTGLSREDILHEAIFEGLSVLKGYGKIDLAKNRAPHRDRSGKLDDDLPF